MVNYDDVPGFVDQLRTQACAVSTRLAFEFLILTATRTGEVLNATWTEIDADTWIIPAERMKTGKEHRVPLAPRCIEILERARKITGGEGFVFPERGENRPLSNMAFSTLLRRGMKKKNTRAHGFRSSFRDWAAERTDHSREVCEMALAHPVPDNTEAAYRRGDLFDKHRDLMSAWALFVTQGLK